MKLLLERRAEARLVEHKILRTSGNVVSVTLDSSATTFSLLDTFPADKFTRKKIEYKDLPRVNFYFKSTLNAFFTTKNSSKQHNLYTMIGDITDEVLMPLVNEI